jgi:hypothetical protein
VHHPTLLGLRSELGLREARPPLSTTLAVFGNIKLRDVSTGNVLKGYTVSISFRVKVGDFDDPAGERVPVTIPVSTSSPVNRDGSFRVESLAQGDVVGKIVVRANSPDRSDFSEKEVAAGGLTKPITLVVEGYRPFVIEPPSETLEERISIHGRAIDTRGVPVAPALGVVLFGVDQVQGGEPGSPRVIASGRTQIDGYFTLPWVPDPFLSAFARINGAAPLPVRLEDAGLLPRRLILVSDAPFPTGNDNGSKTPPRVPDPGDLTANPAAFSQDLGGGCVNLSMPDRTIEEFSYFTVVRTSEPEISGFTPGERTVLPPLLLNELITAAATQEALSLRSVQARHVETLRGLTLDVAAAERLLHDDRAPSIQSIARAAWLSEFDRAKDLLGASLNTVATRTAVDDERPIRWDFNETRVYQTVSIAHGHILQFREVWRADGYSLGDLLSSLPLAPGQRRQVAIVDWDRRNQAVREESLEFEEDLQASLSRDRDIQEIVGSHLSEEMEAGSRNTTWGVSAGFGAGLISGAFGIFGGVAGGASGSSSTAWQDASRSFSANTMQSLRDRVTQRSSSLRDQRATVVQSVAQGETWRAETEVVANYNRCHTITVEYFQVLRHFVVTHELAHVRECLFVPFPLRNFDGTRALRWRETLETFLRDKSLLPGFAALERVADQWQGWDFPESRYSEEIPESLEGELRISFVLPRPRDDEDGKYQISQWRQYSSFIPRDTLELWTANMNAKAARERDEYFRRNVAPEIAANLVAQLEFAYITSSGTSEELTLDGTLVSSYAEGTPLYVTLRPSGNLPARTREEIIAFEIRYTGTELPEDARVIVHSGKLRYRTPHFTALLFNEPRILNDLRAGDPVTISTPLTRPESRNPREEDRELGDRLVRHLNENLEFYLQAVWATLDTEFRFTLLDGMLIPGSNGLSVASVVENRLIGIAGNSLILPLAPGIRLDPRIDDKSSSLEDLYASNPPPPLHIAISTRGVYAEAVQGNCTACEKIDDSRYWRWGTEGLLAPPSIAEVTTQRPSGAEPNLTPTPLPAPLVSIQNAPELPNPTAMTAVLGLLSKPDLFKDITGLAGTQANALKAFNSAMTNLNAIGNDAAALAKQQLALPNTQKMLDRLQGAVNDGLLTPDLAQEFAEEAIRAAIGQPKETDKLPTEDPNAKKAIKAASESKGAEVKVTTPTETVEVKFEDKGTKIGGGPEASTITISSLIPQDFVFDSPKDGDKPAKRTLTSVRLTRVDDVKLVTDNLVKDPQTGVFPLKDVDKTLVEISGSSYKILRRLQIVFPADPADRTKVAGTGRLPIVGILHGQSAHWEAKKTTNFNSFQGYSYLQAYLAQNGIVSVSVDTNAANYIQAYIEMRAEMLLEGLEKLRQLDLDKKSPLFGRLDMQNVGLLGHSRGGDAVVRAALMKKARGAEKEFGIKAVCSLAPSDMTGGVTKVGHAESLKDFAAGNFPTTGPHTIIDGSLTYLVVCGGLDADVDCRDGAFGAFGSGFRHYDRARCPKAMVFLHHCNHRRFNEVWKSETTGRDDPGMTPEDLGTVTGVKSRLLSPADHRALANDYIGGFFRWMLKGEQSFAGLFTGAVANSVKAEASLQWTFGVGVQGLENMENSTKGELFPRSTQKATVDQFGKIKIGVTTQEFRTQHQTGVLAVDPNLAAPTPAVMRLTFDPPQDWMGFKWLRLRVTADFDLTSETTIATGGLPQFEIVLGNATQAVRVDQSKFSPPMTRPVLHEVVEKTKRVGVTLLKLGTVRVLLDIFPDLKRDKITFLEIHPGANFPKHMFFDSLQLEKGI